MSLTFSSYPFLAELGLSEEGWAGAVRDMRAGCHVLPLDLAAVEADMQGAAGGKELAELTEEELWAPALPPWQRRARQRAA